MRCSFVTDNTGLSSFVYSHCWLVASQIFKITQNSEKIRTYSNSRLSKVIDLGANRKRMCIYFLLIINSNYVDVSHYHFRAVDIVCSYKIASFPHSTLV